MRLFIFGDYWHLGTFFIVFLIGFAFYSLGKIGAVKKNSSSYFLLFLILLFFYTFRDITHGADTGTYAMAFQKATALTNEYNAGFEPLFRLYTFIIRLFTNKYNVYFLITGVLICGAYVYFIKTFWSGRMGYVFLFLLAVEFFYDINIMRSAIAGSLFLIAFSFLSSPVF